MLKPFFACILCFILFTVTAKATTWDEPWAEQVIKEARSFILCKVIYTDETKGITVVVIKTLGGIELSDTLTITNFSSLKICSSSGNGADFRTQVIDSCFMFLSKNSKGELCIPTPTTGFDYVEDGNVMSTFRHSYHQAFVPVAIYEKMMTAVFNHYHSQPYDKEYVNRFVNEHLKQSPAGFDETEINTFFLQHVAMECVFHLQLEIDGSLLLPFLHDKGNFHNQVSAARAMRSVNTEANKQELLEAIADTSKRDFVRVICTWSLATLKPVKMKTQLEQLEKNAPDEGGGFGGNIMDPRVCTRMPSLKQALKELIGKL